MKRIIITAANGFLGDNLCTHFAKSYEVIALVRTLLPDKENITYVKWDGKTLGDWKSYFDDAHALINLAGRSVDCRYHEENKRLILQSRLESTKVLAEAIEGCKVKPTIWINSASATIYAHSLEKPNSESKHVIGSGFSVDVCQKWEKSFFEFSHADVRQVALRTTIVLGKDGGAFPIMKKMVKLFLGGKQGNGNQMISWIHIDDFKKAVDHVLSHKDIKGVINIGSPNPVQNVAFMRELRSACKRTFGLPAPKWLLNFGARIIKTETELILKSRFIQPEKLIQTGFEFDYPTIDSAMSHLVK
ncbi:MAG: TIGR01777 family protein [Crocinitomicaceae bacterium]|nr:TIGR01777 family oxidoreductase [Flavobacteriales bacterium]NQZ34358.1 TIGR01777 family protein [Crocinitomicaceae bacterium]